MNSQFKALNMTLAVLNRFQPVKLVEFLVSLQEAFDAFRKS